MRSPAGGSHIHGSSLREFFGPSREARPAYIRRMDRLDFIQRNWTALSLRAMGRQLGVSPTRVRQLAAGLGLKPHPPVAVHPWQCKGCGKQERRAGRKRAALAFCDACKPKAGGIGPRAYHERHAMQKPWPEIAALVGSRSGTACRRQARRYADRKGLPWPIKPLTMEEVLRLADRLRDKAQRTDSPPDDMAHSADGRLCDTAQRAGSPSDDAA